MAQKSIREYEAKQLIASVWHKYFDEANLHYSCNSWLVEAGNLESLNNAPSWTTKKLVAKPDELFGKRGKNGLVLVNKSLLRSLSWIKDKSVGTTTLSSGITGDLKYFLVEPFVPHQLTDEYYLAIRTERSGNQILISKKGGVDIEEHWEQTVQTIKIDLGVSKDSLLTQLFDLGYDNKHSDFIARMYSLFCAEDFAYLEFNPYCIQGNTVYLLDCVAKLDDTAAFLHSTTWGDLIFPKAFGTRTLTEQEEQVGQLDAKSGASLKLTLLHPQGFIYPLFSGGGASVALSDLITETLGAEALAIYGEYSGNPSSQETQIYTNAVLDLMLENTPKGAHRILLIAGGIANFTDIYETFQGIIASLTEYQKALQKLSLTILVRRGGPNATKGLQALENAGKNLGLTIEVYNQEVSLGGVVAKIPAILPI